MNQNFKRNPWLKKSAAVCMAALLGVTAAPVSAFAEGTYNDVEKAAMAEGIKNFALNYANGLSEYDAVKSGIHEDMILTIDDAGRSILGFMVPVDISWLKELKLSTNVSMAEGAQFMDAELLLNDTKLCTLEYYFDLANMVIYIKIPELREGYLKVDYAAAMAAQQEALEAQREEILASEDLPEDFDMDAYMEELDTLSSSFNSVDFMRGYMSVLSDLPAFMPDSAVIEELLNKYGSILFNHTAEGTTGEETLTIGDITKNCTVYEGQLTQEGAIAMMQEFLDTAKADEQLKNILNSWDEKIPEAEDLYDTFLFALEEFSDDVADLEADDDTSYISSKIWTDENGEITGRLLSVNEDGETIPLVNLQTLNDGNNFESLFQFGPSDEGMELKGNGQITDGILNGTYELAIENESVASIEISNYDKNSAKDGYYNGNYKITPIVPETEDPSLKVLENFGLLMDIVSDKDSGNIDLSLTSGGSTLGRLSIVADTGVTVEKPDTADLTDVYDVMNEEAMTEYMSGVTFDTLLNNLLSAGVPEEVIMFVLNGGSPVDEGAETVPETTIENGEV